jgi:ABC-type multidrug transport system ATPase subunit
VIGPGLVRPSASAPPTGRRTRASAGESLGLDRTAGKSTTVRILATLLAPTSGACACSPDPVGDGAPACASASCPRSSRSEHLSARENLEFLASLQGLSGTMLSDALQRGLVLAGLAERAGDRVKTFSGGMKRRLNIAVALVHGPELVFLDEPTVGIDPQSRERIFEMVEALHARGVAMIYTSHQLGEVERLCDRIVILDRGRKSPRAPSRSCSATPRSTAAAARACASLPGATRRARRPCSPSAVSPPISRTTPRTSSASSST